MIKQAVCYQINPEICGHTDHCFIMQSHTNTGQKVPLWAKPRLSIADSSQFVFFWKLSLMNGWTLMPLKEAPLGTSVVPLQACAFHRSLFWKTSSFHSALKFLMSTVSREPCPVELLSEPMLFTLCRLASSDEMLFRLKGSWKVSPQPLVRQIQPHCSIWLSSKIKWIDGFLMLCYLPYAREVKRWLNLNHMVY